MSFITNIPDNIQLTGTRLIDGGIYSCVVFNDLNERIAQCFFRCTPDLQNCESISEDKYKPDTNIGKVQKYLYVISGLEHWKEEAIDYLLSHKGKSSLEEYFK